MNKTELDKDITDARAYLEKLISKHGGFFIIGFDDKNNRPEFVEANGGNMVAAASLRNFDRRKALFATVTALKMSLEDVIATILFLSKSKTVIIEDSKSPEKTPEGSIKSPYMNDEK